MRTVLEAAGSRQVDTTDGVRVIEGDRGWVLVLPDPADAFTRLWAEGSDADAAQQLLDEWAAVVEQAGRLRAADRSGPGSQARIRVSCVPRVLSRTARSARNSQI
jgi:hypothetical protein